MGVRDSSWKHSITYPLWYTHRHGNRAIISPAFKSSKQITHSPFGSLRTSSANTTLNKSSINYSKKKKTLSTSAIKPKLTVV